MVIVENHFTFTFAVLFPPTFVCFLLSFPLFSFLIFPSLSFSFFCPWFTFFFSTLVLMYVSASLTFIFLFFRFLIFSTFFPFIPSSFPPFHFLLSLLFNFLPILALHFPFPSLLHCSPFFPISWPLHLSFPTCPFLIFLFPTSQFSYWPFPPSSTFLAFQYLISHQPFSWSIFPAFLFSPSVDDKDNSSSSLLSLSFALIATSFLPFFFFSTPILTCICRRQSPSLNKHLFSRQLWEKRSRPRDKK